MNFMPPLLSALVWILSFWIVVWLSWKVSHFIFGGNRTQLSDLPMVVAHRGGAGYGPENTLAAIGNVIGKQVKAIEIDVQMTKDGQLALMHDKDVKRTTDGKGNLKSLTVPLLKDLDAGTWFDSQYKDERVPLLNQVFAMPSLVNTLVFIEVKHPKFYPKISQALVNAINEHTNPENIVVMSFDIDFVLKFKQANPNIKTGALCVLPSQANRYQQIEYVVMHWASFVFTPKTIYSLRASGYTVFAWTPNTDFIKGKLKRHGVDGIITDFP